MIKSRHGRLSLLVNKMGLEVAANARTGAVYWIEVITNAGIFINRHDPSGGNRTILYTEESLITSLTVDEVGEKLYYAYVTNDGYEIRRCDLDGGNPQTVLSNRGARVYGLDVVPQSPVQAKLYWSESNRETHEGWIGRADVVYGIGFDPAIVVSDLGFPSDLSVDPTGGKIYWVDYDRRQVQRANSDGSAVETLVDSIPASPYSLTLDLSAKKIFWVDFGTDTIERSDFDGSHREAAFTIYGAYRIDIGPDGPVGIDPRGLGQIKQMYR